MLVTFINTSKVSAGGIKTGYNFSKDRTCLTWRGLINIFINQPEVHSGYTDGEIQVNFEIRRLERPLILLGLSHGPLAQLAEQLTCYFGRNN